jgi:hypothetical protein
MYQIHTNIRFWISIISSPSPPPPTENVMFFNKPDLNSTYKAKVDRMVKKTAKREDGGRNYQYIMFAYKKNHNTARNNTGAKSPRLRQR